MTPLPPPGEQILNFRSRCDGTVQPARLYLPRRPRRRYPCLVCLHGFGGRMTAWPVAVQHLADAFGWVLLSPDGRGSQNWDGLGEDDVFEALAAAERIVRLDPERLYLHGGSMGGHGALRLALRHPRRFAAVSAVAGWLSAEQFYPKWYAPPGAPAPPAILADLIAAAAPGTWREHAATVPGRLAFGTADRVNEAADAEWFIAWLRRRGWFGGRWTAARVTGGGHGAGLDWWAVFRFLRRHRRRWPRQVHSPTLRHADGGWWRAERLIDPLAPMSLTWDLRGDELVVTVENVAELRLDFRAGPQSLRRAAQVRVNGTGCRLGPEPLTVTLSPPGGRYPKRRGTDGPFGELFRDRFQVVAPAGGVQREAAWRFCGDWNAWCVHHWRGEPSGDQDWWRPRGETPAYPWPTDEASVVPVRPEQASPESNLLLFGGPDENELVRRWAAWPGELPFRPLADGLALAGEAFRGEAIGYLALHPLPWDPARLGCLMRGYQHSGIDPAEWGPARLGKDLERLPWQWPDLVIWDGSRVCRMTVQPPLRHLPDAWLLAARFGPGWGWSGSRVWREG